MTDPTPNDHTTAFTAAEAAANHLTELEDRHAAELAAAKAERDRAHQVLTTLGQTRDERAAAEQRRIEAERQRAAEAELARRETTLANAQAAARRQLDDLHQMIGALIEVVAACDTVDRRAQAASDAVWQQRQALGHPIPAQRAPASQARQMADQTYPWLRDAAASFYSRRRPELVG